MEYGNSPKLDHGPAAQMSQHQMEQMRTCETPMLPPWSNIKAKRAWKIQAAGQVQSLNFTPGGAHIVAVVQSGSTGRSREIQIFETKTSQEVIVEPQENRPPSYHSLADLTVAGGNKNNDNTGGGHHHLDISSSAGHFVLHPGGGFEESIVRPDIGGSRLTVVDLEYPKEGFDDPDDALVAKLQNTRFPLAISPAPQVLPGCDEVFAGVDSEEKGVLRVFSWTADEHLLRRRREWEFQDDEITHLEFTGDGRRVVCLTKNKYCRVVDLAKDEQHETQIPTSHEPEMLRTYQSADGAVQVVVSVWQGVVVVSHGYRGDQTDIYSLLGAVGKGVRALCLTKDCEFLACATDNGVDIFQPRTRRIVQKGLGRGLVGITKGCFSDDGRHIAVADSVGRISLLKLSGPQWVR